MAMGTKMFSRMNYQVQRGMKELYTIHQLSEKDWFSIKVFFGNKCTYCGTPDTGNPRDGLVPDHLIPASESGDYIIGNVIAACHKCNDRRGNKPWEAWLYLNYPEEAEFRKSRIIQYLEKYPYKPPISPECRLKEDELREYFEILNEWDYLWKRARNLRDRINSRLDSINE